MWDSEPPLRGDVCFGRASSGPRGNSRPSEGVTEWPAQGGTTSLPRSPRQAVLGVGRRTRGAGASRLRVRQSGACTCHSGPAPVTHACLARSSRPLRPPLPPGTGDGRLPRRTTRLLRNGPTAAPFPSPALISCKLPVTTRLPASGVTELMGNEGKAPRACTRCGNPDPKLQVTCAFCMVLLRLGARGPFAAPARTSNLAFAGGGRGGGVGLTWTPEPQPGTCAPLPCEMG